MTATLNTGLAQTRATAAADVPASGALDILRFTTAGSVDDGKSTLIGRLLYDSKSIMEDQLETLERSADLTGRGSIDLATLTDGLRSEREQGITIDVAYRYFSTPRRRFIIADTPGHVQYTRNMVTGASTANLALVLIDARKGVLEQSRRHAYIAALLRIPHLVVCINKMDLVDYSEQRFEEIRAEFAGFLPRLDIRDVSFIPISALEGDNVVTESVNMPWYHGPTLLNHLETVYIASDYNMRHFRMPVQWVNRPQKSEWHDFRGFAGQIAGGLVRPGDEVMVLPTGLRSKVKEIWTYDGPLEEAWCPMSVTLRLEDEIDVSRGSLLCAADRPPFLANQHRADLCWMHPQPLHLGRKYVIKQGAHSARAIVTELEHRIDISTLEADTAAATLGPNDIGRIHFRTSEAFAYDSYRDNRLTGAFILVDEASNATIAAGMMMAPQQQLSIDTSDYAI